jgi:hypothetical protein
MLPAVSNLRVGGMMVRREVAEETGVTVGEVSYLG